MMGTARWGKRPQPFSWIYSNYPAHSASRSLFQGEHQEELTPPLNFPEATRSCRGWWGR